MYIIEGDIPIRTIEELADEYQRMIDRVEVEASGVAQATRGLSISTHDDGVEMKWSPRPCSAGANLLTPLDDLPFGPGKSFRFEGRRVEQGDVVVELNSADNGNRWVAVSLRGSIGLIDGGRVNRDGIGGVVRVSPARGKPVMRPIAAGGPYASNDALEKTFGLGRARHAQVDVLWPGGVKNRLHRVSAGSRITMPEIPCSIDDHQRTFRSYFGCVRRALEDLHDQGRISSPFKRKLFRSALWAWFESR